jgi:hypothetical protein
MAGGGLEDPENWLIIDAFDSGTARVNRQIGVCPGSHVVNARPGVSSQKRGASRAALRGCAAGVKMLVAVRDGGLCPARLAFAPHEGSGTDT